MELEIARILRALRRGEFILTRHATRRMHERNISVEDIQNITRSYTEVIEQQNGVYKIVGFDLISEVLVVIAAFDGSAVIITVF